jgi:membrane protein involved in colicin uptake
MRSTIVATVLAIATLVAAPAFAAPAQGNGPAKTQRAEGEKGERGKAHFPMPAAEFQAKVNARQARARQHMEERAAKLNAEEAKELRAKFDAAQQKVNAEVAKAVADGTVTKEEAKAVREASPHHGKHARHHAKGGKPSK